MSITKSKNHDTNINILPDVNTNMNNDTFFNKMVDELIDFAEFDPKLKEGIKWLDEQALKEGLTFYEMVHKVLSKRDDDLLSKLGGKN